MKTKHTPGPWTIDDISAEGGGWESIVILSKIQRDDHNFHHVCSVDWGGSDDDEPAIGEISGEDRANARLIAAAPELLEACESMLKTCGGSEYWKGETQKSLVLIEAAIAKVKGGKRPAWPLEVLEELDGLTPEQALDWWGLESVDYEGDE